MNFEERRQFRKIDFELKMYSLDADINQIRHDLETSDNPKTIRKYFERVQYLVETYRELMLSGIRLDISYDQGYMETLAGMLFDRYCALV
ncbi:MAG: hypothetical protein IJH65_13850 [Methanobrevibacter sp.]|nr:hypothetical protein [Methanobrevibacter sp.]